MKLIDTQLGPFHVPDTGTVTRALENGQWWDWHLKAVIDRAGDGEWALDLGANVGWFTRYLSETFDRVLAVEPWPETFQLLVENRKGARWHRDIECWPVAAYSRPCVLGPSPVNDPTDLGGHCYLPGSHLSPKVVGVILDDYLPADAPVTLIKSDCQGADLHALRGLHDTILRCRPLIVFEWEAALAEAHGDDWDGYLRFFAELKYSVERITTDFWDYVARPL